MILTMADPACGIGLLEEDVQVNRSHAHKMKIKIFAAFVVLPENLVLVAQAMFTMLSTVHSEVLEWCILSVLIT